MKYTMLIGLILTFALLHLTLASAEVLRLDKNAFNPGENIQVYFESFGNFDRSSWVGIVPSNVAHGSEAENDKYDLTYQYLEKRTSGTLTFKAPQEPGSYDLRMFDTDSNGREVASVTFSVVAKGTLRLDKESYRPGEDITASFEASDSFDRSAWVGIVPSNVAHGSEAENDKYDLTYQFLEKRTSGTLSFKAPQAPGSYDLRMFDTDSNGREVASATFSVDVAKGTLRLEYKPGEDIHASFEASDSFDRSAWVGIVPSNVAHGSEAENDKYDLTYQFLEKRTSGTLSFKAPQAPGSYDLRMFDTDSNGREVSSVTFSVVSKGTLRLDKDSYKPGEDIHASFEASDSFDRSAWVGIVPSNVAHGSEAENDKHDLTYQFLEKRTSGTLSFKAPKEPGSYDLRMFDTDDNGQEVASASFVV